MKLRQLREAGDVSPEQLKASSDNAEAPGICNEAVVSVTDAGVLPVLWLDDQYQQNIIDHTYISEMSILL